MTIAVIDKYPIVRLGIQAILKEHFDLTPIAVYDTMDSFDADSRGKTPDVIILSLNEQKADANIQTLNFTRKYYSVSRIIIYDESVNEAMVSKYFQSGISGFLGKKGLVTELVKCIEKALKGEPYISTDLIYSLLTAKHVASQKSSPKAGLALTSREIEIATLLIDGERTSDIARNLQRKISTISTIKANIFKKMRVTNIINLRDAMAV